MQVSGQEQGSAFSGHVIQASGAGGHGRRPQRAAARLHGSVEQELQSPTPEEKRAGGAAQPATPSTRAGSLP